MAAMAARRGDGRLASQGRRANVVHDQVTPRLALRAGPVSVDLIDGDLRYLRVGDREVLRRIYFALRDRTWGTVPGNRTNVLVEDLRDGFRVTYVARYRAGAIDFECATSISGDPDGTVRFDVEGRALSSFQRNRIGLCVLHPIRECSGRPCTVEHTDGSLEHGAFPDSISPFQPFQDIVAITHEVMAGLTAEVRFEGDIFEMEDQRNWTDASFKTYSTPLRLAFPAAVEAGTVVRQSVTLRLIGNVPSLPVGDQRLMIRLGQRKPIRKPRLGLQVVPDGHALSAGEVERLRALLLDHLRVDLRLADAAYMVTLRRAVAEAHAIGAQLEVAISLTNAAERELGDLRRVVAAERPDVAVWLVFHEAEPVTAATWVALARRYLAGLTPAARFGGGTQAWFAELNRNRPQPVDVDVACYSITPQVHAVDDLSLIETIEGQAATVRTAREFLDEVPIAITPVTLLPRVTAAEVGLDTVPGRDGLRAGIDHRQASLLGAGWTAASIGSIGSAGVWSATYYETIGERGVMETDRCLPQLDSTRSIAGRVFPMYHVLADVGELRGADIVALESSDRRRIDGIALRTKNLTRVVLANLTPSNQSVTVVTASDRASVRILDDATLDEAMAKPEHFRAARLRPSIGVDGILALELAAYAIATIDLL